MEKKPLLGYVFWCFIIFSPIIISSTNLLSRMSIQSKADQLNVESDPIETIEGQLFLSTQNDKGLEIYNQAGGGSYSIELFGEYAFLGVGTRILVFNVADLDNPILVRETNPLLTRILTLQVNNDYLYALDIHSTLLIYDISDPANPLEVGYYPVGESHDMAIADDFVYIAGEDGLLILDARNSQHPIPASSVNGVRFMGIDIQDSFAFIASSWSGMLIVNISDPYDPIVVYTYPVDFCYDVLVEGNKAFIVDGYSSKLTILDVSKATEPQIISEFELLYNFGEKILDLNNDFIYIREPSCPLHIFDVSQPESPDDKGCYSDPDHPINDIKFSNRIALVADYHGISTIDFSIPDKPKELKSYQIPLGAPVGIDLYRSYAVITDHKNRLQVIDYSDPSSIDVVGSIPLENYPGRIKIYGDFAFIGHSNPHYIAAFGFEIVNLSDPEHPTLWKPDDQSWYIYDIAFITINETPYAFIAGNQLRILDITDPMSPILKNVIPISSNGISISGNYLFNSHDSVIDIYDISTLFVSNTDYPSIGSITCDNPSYMEISGNFLFASTTYGMEIIDISIPDEPSHVTYFGLQGPGENTLGLISSEDYIYLMSTVGLYVINVTNPRQPVQESFFKSTGVQLALDDVGRIIIAGQGNGINFLNHSTTYQISGMVNGVQEAFVSAGARHVAMTRSDGSYTITQLKPGSYSIIAAKSGYDSNPAGYTITIPASKTGINFDLRKQEVPVIKSVFHIEGFVLDQSNNPISGVQVLAGMSGSSFTSEDGSYNIEMPYGLAIGTYEVIAQKPGYVFDGPFLVNVPPGSEIINFKVVGTTNDLIPPSGSIVSPALNETFTPYGIDFHVQANDNSGGSGIDHVVFYIRYNGKWQYLDKDNEEPFIISWKPPTYVITQRMEFHALVFDKEGNMASIPSTSHFASYLRTPYENWVDANRRIYLNQRILDYKMGDNSYDGDNMCASASISMLLASNSIINHDEETLVSTARDIWETIEVPGVSEVSLELGRRLGDDWVTTYVKNGSEIWGSIRENIDLGYPLILNAYRYGGNLTERGHYIVVVGYAEAYNVEDRQIIAYDPVGRWKGIINEYDWNEEDKTVISINPYLGTRGRWKYYKFNSLGIVYLVTAQRENSVNSELANEHTSYPDEVVVLDFEDIGYYYGPQSLDNFYYLPLIIK